MRFTLPHHADVQAENLRAAISAVRGGYTEGVRLLLDDGISPNAVTTQGDPLLLVAAHHGAFRVADLLLSRGADADRANRYGFTALHVAAHRGDLPLVSALLRAGADPDAVDLERRTAATLAQAGGHEACADLLRARSRYPQRIAA